jgi:Fe-S-cluster containining protein
VVLWDADVVRQQANEMNEISLRVEMSEQKTKFQREDLKSGENLCSYCTARCCRYFALPIDRPKTWNDFDFIRWYMMHGSVSIFVESETWYLMVHADCKHLLEDHRCGTYDTRPAICESYTTDECEFEDDDCYDQLFESPEQLWEYAAALLPPKTKKRTVGEPVSLPVVSV